MPIGPHIGDDVKADEALVFVASVDRSGLLMLLVFLRRLDRVAAARPCDQQLRPDQRPFENDAIRHIAWVQPLVRQEGAHHSRRSCDLQTETAQPHS